MSKGLSSIDMEGQGRRTGFLPPQHSLRHVLFSAWHGRVGRGVVPEGWGGSAEAAGVGLAVVSLLCVS